jgi:hypothetical protein
MTDLLVPEVSTAASTPWSATCVARSGTATDGATELANLLTGRASEVLDRAPCA